MLEEYNLSSDDVFAVSTIDLKKEEPAILQLCRNYCLKLVTYTPQELLEVGGEFTRSDFVKFVTGVDNVCERAAKRATNGEIIMKKNCCEHVALSIAKRDWVCEF
ncbi:hypothetical protein SDC9_183345 [bioreactor metagenome]|uniref:CobE/GbiG C-terminal domain-containing protein n=1 Tax=bioreactor metagenome TaxID=1076179 RepID=A0A645HJL9_9ZZZZ